MSLLALIETIERTALKQPQLRFLPVIQCRLTVSLQRRGMVSLRLLNVSMPAVLNLMAFHSASRSIILEQRMSGRTDILKSKAPDYRFCQIFLMNLPEWESESENICLRFSTIV